MLTPVFTGLVTGFFAGALIFFPPMYPAFPLSDWAYVLGFWLGNGWTSEGRVCFSVKTADADRFGAVLAAMPHIGWTVTRRQMRGSVEFRCSSSPCAALLRAIFGKVEAHEKFIPAAWITTWSERARRALLDGLMDSDGHAAHRERNRERCHFTTTNLHHSPTAGNPQARAEKSRPVTY